MMKMEVVRTEVTCALCSRVLDTADSFKQHMLSEHRDRCFNCKYCGKSFLTSLVLKKHLVSAHSHSKNSGFACQVCGKTFKSTEELKTHNAKSRIIPCSICEKKFHSSIKLLNHTQDVHDFDPGDLECKVCHKAFTSPLLMLSHISKSKTYACKHCDQKFHTLSKLHDHNELVHNDYNKQQLPKENMEKKNKDLSEPANSYKCSRCTKCFALERYLANHMKMHTPDDVDCVVCAVRFSHHYFYEKHLLEYYQVDGEIHVFDCHVCRLKFHSYQEQQDHYLKDHEGDVKEDVLACSGCGVKFDNSSLLKTHGCDSNDKAEASPAYMKDPLNTDILNCDQCDLTFSCKTSLDIHIFLNHRKETELKFPCTFCKCSAKFSTEDELTSHISSDHRHYPTTTCEVCFEQIKSNLYRHMERHVRELNLKLAAGEMKCKFCFRPFTTWEKVEEHEQKHKLRNRRKDLTPYKCEQCDKGFSDKGALRKHSIRHTGLKPYACDVCDKRFNDSGNLTKHKKIHTGTSKQHMCHLCSKFFVRPIQLKQHMEKNHIGTDTHDADTMST